MQGEYRCPPRHSLKQTILTKRFAKALKKLNPWLSDDNARKAIRAVTPVSDCNLDLRSRTLDINLQLLSSVDRFEELRVRGRTSTPDPGD